MPAVGYITDTSTYKLLLFTILARLFTLNLSTAHVLHVIFVSVCGLQQHLATKRHALFQEMLQAASRKKEERWKIHHSADHKTTPVVLIDQSLSQFMHAFFHVFSDQPVALVPLPAPPPDTVAQTLHFPRHMTRSSF